MNKTKIKSQATNTIVTIEKGLLGLIAILTVIATAQELVAIVNARKVDLADLLLLFIYTEVLGTVSYTHLTLPTICSV